VFWHTKDIFEKHEIYFHRLSKCSISFMMFYMLFFFNLTH